MAVELCIVIMQLTAVGVELCGCHWI